MTTFSTWRYLPVRPEPCKFDAGDPWRLLGDVVSRVLPCAETRKKQKRGPAASCRAIAPLTPTLGQAVCVTRVGLVTLRPRCNTCMRLL
jgi:hypothetical protein